MNTVTLKGRDLYSKVRLIDAFDAPQTDKNEVEYWRAAYGKHVFIMREAEAKDFSEGAMAELNLEGTERTVVVEGVDTVIEGFAYAGHITYKVAMAIAKNEGELTKLENSYLVQIAPTATTPVEAA